MRWYLLVRCADYCGENIYELDAKTLEDAKKEIGLIINDDFDSLNENEVYKINDFLGSYVMVGGDAKLVLAVEEVDIDLDFEALQQKQKQYSNYKEIKKQKEKRYQQYLELKKEFEK